MPTETLIRRAAAWQGVATFDDGMELHAPAGKTSQEADHHLKDCLAGKIPWREHADALVAAYRQLDDASDGLITPRPAFMMDMIRNPSRGLDWGGTRLKGDSALRAVLTVELTEIVNAVHALADVTRITLPLLENDPRAVATMASRKGREFRAAIDEAMEIAMLASARIGMPALMTKTATGFATSVHWFPRLDYDMFRDPDDLADHYEGITAKRVAAMVDEWVSDPTQRRNFESVMDEQSMQVTALLASLGN